MCSSAITLLAKGARMELMNQVVGVSESSYLFERCRMQKKGKGKILARNSQGQRF